jgi:acyl carrier protein
MHPDPRLKGKLTMPTSSTDADAAELRALLAGALEMSPNEISNSSRFVEDLGVDTLASPRLAVQVENYYGISIRDSLLAGIDSFTDMLALVRSSESELPGR